MQSLIKELTSGDEQRAGAALQSFSALPLSQTRQAYELVIELLEDDDAENRWWATRALTTIEEPGVSVLLVKSLCDPNAGVRQCAALGLRLKPDTAAIPALVKALGDEDHLVRRLASDALATIGEPAVTALLQVMQTGSQESRLGAARALASIGDTRSIPTLFEALDEGSALIEYWANLGLERMGVGMVFFNPNS